MENLKKLISYNYDCIKEILKSSSFLKLKSENVYKLTESMHVPVNNREFNKILNEYKKNKSVYNLLIGKDFIKTDSGIFTPLIYADVEEIKQNDDKYNISIINDYELNINLLVNILDDNESDYIINILLNVDNEKKADILKSFVNNNNIEIMPESAVILTKLPDATAGILNELKQICKEL